MTPLSSCSVADVWVGVSAREALARAWADLDLPIRHARRREPGDPGDRSEQRDERSQVVGAHVEQRACAVREEDVRVGVPGRLPAEEHRRADGERLADGPVVEQRPGCLVRAAEKDVGRAGDPERTPCGLRDEPSAASATVVASGFSV